MAFNKFFGTEKADTLYGTQYTAGDPPPLNGGDDVIFGAGGGDTIYAKFGNDVINGGLGNDKMSGGAGNDTFFFEIGSGNDTITDFSRSSANGPDTDSIVVDGNYLGSTSSFFGTTLYFDYNNDGKSDGTVLLLGVSKSEWALDLQGGALVDRSGLHGAMQNVLLVEQTDAQWTTHSATDGSWVLA